MKKDRADKKALVIDSLQALLYHQLQEDYCAEKILKEYLPSVKNHLSHDEAKGFINEMRNAVSDRMEEIEAAFLELNAPSSEVPSYPAEGIVQEIEELKSLSQPSSVLDAGILSHLRKFLHYQMGNYGALLGYMSPFENFSSTKKRIKHSMDSVQKEEKRLRKLLEGSFFQQGVEDQAYKESPALL